MRPTALLALATAALVAVAPAAAAAPSLPLTGLTATLRVTSGGKTVKTVEVRKQVPAPASSVRDWLKKGHWQFSLYGKDLNTTRTMCPSFCNAVEPGHALVHAPSELTALLTKAPAGKRKLLLTGSIPIAGRGAITHFDFVNWYSRTKAGGVAFTYLDGPLAVLPGQQVQFTVELAIPR